MKAQTICLPAENYHKTTQMGCLILRHPLSVILYDGSLNAGPLPLSDLRHVDAYVVDVSLVSDQLVTHLLDKE